MFVLLIYLRASYAVCRAKQVLFLARLSVRVSVCLFLGAKTE